MKYQLLTPAFSLDSNASITERIFANRGMAPISVEKYLHTTDKNILNPELIDNMFAGVQMLAKHIVADDKIMIQVDSDCDGYTSAALLLNYLNCIFPAYTQTKILYRFHQGKEHGIIVDTIPADVKLVIAPDSSSNDYEQHEALAKKGIDVLVIDHHEADKVSQYACVINNQLCNYPTKSLSGVGMVYKFCSYFDYFMNLDEPYADLFLDLVAVGMVADMMDLRDYETKHLISKGLHAIRNPFINGIVQKNAYSIGDELTPFGVSFYVAPFVNATIRMGTPEEKRMMFEAMLDFKGYEQVPSTKRGCSGQMESRVEQAVRNCTNIKNHQAKARDNGLDIIESLIKKNNLLKNKLLIVPIPKILSIEKNLTGLIANQLMAKYQRPVLLLNENNDPIYATSAKGDKVLSFPNTTWEGSARGYDKSELSDFRNYLNSTGLVMYAQGHANAFGAGVTDINLPRLIEQSNRDLADFDFSPSYNVDVIYQANDFNSKEILDIAELKSIWGQGLEEPYIALEGVKVSKDNIILMSPDKKPTLKITLPNGVSIIKFKSSQEEYESLQSQGYFTLDIVGRCERNVWNGNVSAQIIMEDYNIVSEMKYYF